MESHALNSFPDKQAVYGLRLYQHYVLCVTTRAIHDYERFIPFLTGKGILPCVGRFRGFPLYLECKLNFPKIGSLYSRTGCLAYHLCVIDSYKINKKFISNFFLFLPSLCVLTGLQPFRQQAKPHYR